MKKKLNIFWLLSKELLSSLYLTFKYGRMISEEYSNGLFKYCAAGDKLLLSKFKNEDFVSISSNFLYYRVVDINDILNIIDLDRCEFTIWVNRSSANSRVVYNVEFFNFI